MTKYHFVLAVLICSALGVESRAARPFIPPTQLWTISPTTESELQQWIVLHWQWYESGQVPAGAENFAFSHPGELPSGFHPFNQSFELFESLYADRLVFNPTSGPGYGIEQLIEDDAVVRSQFIAYTITGLLHSGMFVDPNANQRFIEAALDALFVGDKFEVIDAWFLQGNGELMLMSAGLKKKPKPTTSSPVPPVSPFPTGLLPFHEDLQEAIEDGNVDDVPYIEDDWWPWHDGGFDCDDAGDASGGWLRRRLGTAYEGVEAFALPLRWREGRIGHIVTVIYYNGYYWIIDGQTGRMIGPFPVSVPFTDIDLRPLLEPYNIEPNDPITIKPRRDLGDRPWVEPYPWWENPAMREHLEDATGHPWGEYLPPGIQVEPEPVP